MPSDRLDLCDHWFAVQVWTGREQLTARQLRLRGYEVFLPCYRERRGWSDRMKVVERALFPAYVFCRLRDDVRAAVVTTPSVIRLVGDGNGPVPVPLEEIETIQRIVDTQLRVEPWPYLETGQRVCIDAGPLRGTYGIVKTVKNTQRIVVSVELLQRSVAVEIDPSWVRMSHEEVLHSLRARTSHA